MIHESTHPTYHHVAISCHCGFGEELSRPTRQEAHEALGLFGWRIKGSEHICPNCMDARREKRRRVAA